MPLVYFCWHCYAENREASGACTRCGHAIEAPADTDRVDGLIWALDHPIAESQMIAAVVLANLCERRASDRLRRLVTDAPDTLIAAQALRSLAAIEGVEAVKPLLEDRAEHGPVAVRRTAQALLDHQHPAPACGA